MTEARVFQILLKGEKYSNYSFDFPKQQSETVKVVARNLTDIIYESYKRKSCASTSKRHQVLKFINNVCDVPEQHVYEDYMKCALQQVDRSFRSTTEDQEVEDLRKKIEFDLKHYSNNHFQQSITECYSRKIQNEKERSEKEELINEAIQEQLDKKYHLKVRKTYSFEANENLVKKLLAAAESTFQSSDVISDNRNFCDRETLVKLGYTMLNLGLNDALKKILVRLSHFDELKKAETDFMQYIWLKHYDVVHVYIHECFKNFFFLLERTLLTHATNMVGLKDEQEVCQYLVGIEDDCDILKMKQICKGDFGCYLKIKTLLYELYCISYCNKNILRLCEIIV